MALSTQPKMMYKILANAWGPTSREGSSEEEREGEKEAEKE
jgi:hypothetical protein